MGGGWSSTRGRVLAGVGVGVLTRWITPGLVDEVLAGGVEAGAGQRRFRALPGRLGVYFVLGLCLFSDLPYRAVLRELTWGLGGALQAAGWWVPASTALTGLRRRLGDKPFELLFWRLCCPLSPGRARWSHICGLLAVAWDGTTVAAPASAPNLAVFGEVSGRKPGHYPRARLVVLIACGTRALLGAAVGPWRGTGERALAAGLVSHLHAGMLLLAGRGFYSFGLWRAAAGTGAALLWRVTAGLHLPVVTTLPDGSWLTHINEPAAVRRRLHRNGARRRRGSTLGPDTGPLPGITVRVIEFWLAVTTADGTTRTERYRLITTLTDWRTAPAPELAAGYAWRWAAETGFKELKTFLHGTPGILRGRTPELARQELWAYLTIYQAIRTVICLAAASASLDPSQISFTATLHAIRRTLPLARTSPATALATTQASILTELIPRRQPRISPRAVTRPCSPYRSRGNNKDPISQHAHYHITISHPPHTPHTHPDQPQHTTTPHNQPP